MNERDRMTVTLEVPAQVYRAVELFATHNHTSVESVMLQAITNRFGGYATDASLTESEIRQMVSNMARRLDASQPDD